MAISLAEAEELAKEEGVDVWVFASRCAQRHAAADLPAGRPGARGLLRPRASAPASRAAGVAAARGLHRRRRPGLGLSVLAEQEEGRGQRLRGQDRRRRDLPPSRSSSPSTTWCSSCCTTRSARGGRARGLPPRTRRTPRRSRSCGTKLRPARRTSGRICASSVAPTAKADRGGRRRARSTAGRRAAKDIKVLDPCCGSGHFLVAALHYLVPIRMAEEGLSARGSRRCGAARQPARPGDRPALHSDRRVRPGVRGVDIPMPAATGRCRTLNIACTGIGPQSTEEQWVKLAEQSGMPMPDMSASRSRTACSICTGSSRKHRRWALSSIPTNFTADLIAADYETIQPYLAAILKAEKTDDETARAGCRRRRHGQGRRPLGRRVHARHHERPVPGPRQAGRRSLKTTGQEHEPDAKADLATMFICACSGALPTAAARAHSSRRRTGCSSPLQEAPRTAACRIVQWNLVARLGPGHSRRSAGEVVNVALLRSDAVLSPSTSHLARH